MIYSHGMVNISNILNKSKHEVPDVDPVMILIIFICNWNTFLLIGKLVVFYISTKMKL